MVRRAQHLLPPKIVKRTRLSSFSAGQFKGAYLARSAPRFSTRSWLSGTLHNAVMACWQRLATVLILSLQTYFSGPTLHYLPWWRISSPTMWSRRCTMWLITFRKELSCPRSNHIYRSVLCIIVALKILGHLVTTTHASPLMPSVYVKHYLLCWTCIFQTLRKFPYGKHILAKLEKTFIKSGQQMSPPNHCNYEPGNFNPTGINHPATLTNNVYGMPGELSPCLSADRKSICQPISKKWQAGNPSQFETFTLIQ